MVIFSSNYTASYIPSLVAFSLDSALLQNGAGLMRGSRYLY